MGQAPALSTDEAREFTRPLDGVEELVGFRMAAMSGNSPVPLASLAEVESFLVVLTQEQIASMDVRQRIHYIDPKALTSWVREVVGDVDLANRLDEVVAAGEVYGALVPRLKESIAQRLAEYAAVLGEDEVVPA